MSSFILNSPDIFLTLFLNLIFPTLVLAEAECRGRTIFRYTLNQSLSHNKFTAFQNRTQTIFLARSGFLIQADRPLNREESFSDTAGKTICPNWCKADLLLPYILQRSLSAADSNGSNYRGE